MIGLQHRGNRGPLGGDYSSISIYVKVLVSPTNYKKAWVYPACRSSTSGLREREQSISVHFLILGDRVSATLLREKDKSADSATSINLLISWTTGLCLLSSLE